MEHDEKSTNSQTEDATPAPVNSPKQHKQLTQKWLFSGVAVAAILIAGVVIFMVSNRRTPSAPANTQSQTQGNDAFMQQYGQNCKDRDVSFTSGPLGSADLAYIRPLGGMLDGHVTPTDHVYVGPTNPNAPDNTYSVLMPANGTIVEVDAMPNQYIGDRTGTQLAPEDHRIVMSFSCRYFSIYIHVHKLSDALKTAVGTLQPSQNKMVNVELKAGDTIGYIGGSTFDWIPIDTSQKLKGFITPSLYEGEPWKIHVVSPFDLYGGALKTQLEAKSLRTVSPLGGKIDYDQPGKLIGNWFRQGTGGYAGKADQTGRYWDGHLAIAPDPIDPASTIVSIGNWTGTAMQFVVNGTVDPANVDTTKGMVKYELKKASYVTASGGQWNGASLMHGIRVSQAAQIEGTIAFQVLGGEKLKLEKFPGKTATQVNGFTTAAETYER